MLREAARAPPLVARRDHQRVLRARPLVERVIEQPLAQPVGGDDRALALQMLEQRRQHRRRVAERRDTAGGQARNRLQPPLRDVRDRPPQPRDRFGRHRILVDDRQRIMGAIHVQPRQRAPRSTDQIERQPLARAAPAGLAQQPPDAAIQPALLAQRRNPQHAEREGGMFADLAVLHPHQLKAAPAEIADDAVRLRDRGKHAIARAACFRRAGKKLHGQPGRFRHREQFGAVGSIARGGGGDGAHRVAAHLACQRGEAGERGRGGGHRLGIDRAGLGEAAPQPGQHLLVEQDRRQTRWPLIDDQSDRVRADVDDRRARRRHSVSFSLADATKGSAPARPPPAPRHGRKARDWS